jgi:hypothetical protein
MRSTAVGDVLVELVVDGRVEANLGQQPQLGEDLVVHLLGVDSSTGRVSEPSMCAIHLSRSERKPAQRLWGRSGTPNSLLIFR